MSGNSDSWAWHLNLAGPEAPPLPLSKQLGGLSQPSRTFSRSRSPANKGEGMLPVIVFWQFIIFYLVFFCVEYISGCWEQKMFDVKCSKINISCLKNWMVQLCCICKRVKYRFLDNSTRLTVLRDLSTVFTCLQSSEKKAPAPHQSMLEGPHHHWKWFLSK